MSVRLCKDCKHYRRNEQHYTTASYDKCGRQERIDLVRGGPPEVGLRFCETDRFSTLPDYCGPGGQYWEAIET